MKLRLLFLLLLLTPVALAANYDIDIVPRDNDILPNESAVFDIIINNFENNGERFQLYTINTDWVLRVEPPISVVAANSQSKHKLYVRPKANVGFGSQGVAIQTKNLNDGIIQKQTLIIHISDPESRGREYAASVQLDVAAAELVNPRNPYKVAIAMRNRNNLDIRDMKIEIISPLFERIYTTDLAPVAEKKEEVTFPLDFHQAPGTYDLRVRLSYEEQVVSEHVTTFTIDTISDIKESIVDTPALFKHTAELSVTNEGNQFVDYQAKLPTNALRSFFTSTNPRAEKIKIGGERYLVWSVPLKPEETTVVVATTNYRLLVLLIIMGIAGVILYYVMRAPLIAVKETVVLGDSDGSDLKIRIFLKNRTGAPLESVSVIDRVPSIASYVKKETLGVISPTKVVSAPKKGTVLKWELDILEPFEERILSYELSSKLKIVGRIRLPPAKIHYAGRGGRERVTYTKSLAAGE